MRCKICKCNELQVHCHKSSHYQQNSQLRRGIHRIQLLSHLRKLYNVPSYPPQIDIELRCPMTQATVTQQYSGVYCRACGEPISLPARAEKALTAQQAGTSEGAGESQPVVFNLRCKACEKENFYGAKDVANIHGAPRLARPRARTTPSLLRPNLKLTRTANA
jgi:hypothetical protein